MPKIAICAPSHNYVGYIFTTKACIDNRKKTCWTAIPPPHVLTIWWTFGPLTAEISWPVCGTPANFNGFRVLASLLQRRRSTEVNQTLHDVWPSPALLHYVYISGGSCPITEFCQVQNSHCVQILRSGSLASSLHGTRGVGISLTLLRSAATYIRQGGHHDGHQPTF